MVGLQLGEQKMPSWHESHLELHTAFVDGSSTSPTVFF